VRAGPLRIIVLIKQVPETSNVRIDEATGTMVREGVECIINPHDLYAIEAALQLKEATQPPGRVTVLSLGPRRAEREIREALAMGCDEGVLLSAPAFAGSDTWATSLALSCAIRRMRDFDLVICGVRATDGETGQVGPGVASFLDLPLATYVSRIVQCCAAQIEVECLLEDGYETLRLPLPCVLTVVKEIAFPRLPTLRGKQRARAQVVPVWGPAEIGLAPGEVGLAGSPTRVVKVTRPKATRDGTVVNADKAGVQVAVRQLVDYLAEHGAVGNGRREGAA